MDDDDDDDDGAANCFHRTVGRRGGLQPWPTQWGATNIHAGRVAIDGDSGGGKHTLTQADDVAPLLTWDAAVDEFDGEPQACIKAQGDAAPADQRVRRVPSPGGEEGSYYSIVILPEHRRVFCLFGRRHGTNTQCDRVAPGARLHHHNASAGSEDKGSRAAASGAHGARPLHRPKAEAAKQAQKQRLVAIVERPRACDGCR